MITIRKTSERGHFDHGWLDTSHTFSFGEYYDSAYLGFRALRVINEDRVTPGHGFPTHAHSDMEIITYVLEGALEHKDSLGTGSVIRPDDVQRMSAGTGVTHSEYNPSKSDPVHLLQIWILPEQRGIPPGYEQKAFGEREKRDRLRLIASRDGRDGSLTIHQDADVFVTRLSTGATVQQALRPRRQAWVQIARGQVDVNGQTLQQGDGAAISDAAAIQLVARHEAEVLIFDLA